MEYKEVKFSFQFSSPYLAHDLARSDDTARHSYPYSTTFPIFITYLAHDLARSHEPARHSYPYSTTFPIFITISGPWPGQKSWTCKTLIPLLNYLPNFHNHIWPMTWPEVMNLQDTHTPTQLPSQFSSPYLAHDLARSHEPARHSYPYSTTFPIFITISGPWPGQKSWTCKTLIPLLNYLPNFHHHIWPMTWPEVMNLQDTHTPTQLPSQFSSPYLAHDLARSHEPARHSYPYSTTFPIFITISGPWHGQKSWTCKTLIPLLNYLPNFHHHIWPMTWPEVMNLQDTHTPTQLPSQFSSPYLAHDMARSHEPARHSYPYSTTFPIWCKFLYINSFFVYNSMTTSFMDEK